MSFSRPRPSPHFSTTTLKRSTEILRRLAAIIGPSVFTLGAAVGHVDQMVTAHNFAPGNAGIIFWSDIGIPLFGFALLYGSAALSKRQQSAA
jgi:hypothetical protein